MPIHPLFPLLATWRPRTFRSTLLGVVRAFPQARVGGGQIISPSKGRRRWWSDYVPKQGLAGGGQSKGWWRGWSEHIPKQGSAVVAVHWSYGVSRSRSVSSEAIVDAALQGMGQRSAGAPRSTPQVVSKVRAGRQYSRGKGRCIQSGVGVVWSKFWSGGARVGTVGFSAVQSRSESHEQWLMQVRARDAG